ncbi:hypothetical protein BDV93DRAFT_515274 [Ceratobasidium sp. AG-I]|nr:hypothetical protein BDV93DRAFT_515274 [Ceratobasidium sp. AG-I]
MLKSKVSGYAISESLDAESELEQLPPRKIVFAPLLLTKSVFKHPNILASLPGILQLMVKCQLNEMLEKVEEYTLKGDGHKKDVGKLQKEVRKLAEQDCPYIVCVMLEAIASIYTQIRVKGLLTHQAFLRAAAAKALSIQACGKSLKWLGIGLTDLEGGRHAGGGGGRKFNQNPVGSGQIWPEEKPTSSCESNPSDLAGSPHPLNLTTNVPLKSPPSPQHTVKPSVKVHFDTLRRVQLVYKHRCHKYQLWLASWLIPAGPQVNHIHNSPYKDHHVESYENIGSGETAGLSAIVGLDEAVGLGEAEGLGEAAGSSETAGPSKATGTS